MELEFFASCLAGLEKPLAEELKSLGIERVRPLGGGVAFFSDAEGAYRACLWSRIASRIMMVLGRTNAGDADLLYAGAYDVAWEDVLASDATMAVRAHGSNDQLRNSRFTALKVKDAVVDRLRDRRGSRIDVDTESPRALIDVRIHERKATISLDFSGEALNRRAYLSPDDGQDAALACSLAAGALALGGWDEMSSRQAASPVFVDPVCRDGIVLVEAAQVACDCAPGLSRSKWGFFGWTGFREDDWSALVADAERRFAAGIERIAGAGSAASGKAAPPDLSRVRFVGASNSSPSISKSRDHVRRAGLRSAISVESGDAATMPDLFKEHKMLRQARSMMVLSNLDSLSRADAPAHVQADESAFVKACSLAPADARFVAIGGQDVESRFGCAPDEHAVVGKGRVQTTVDVYESAPAAALSVEVPDLSGGASRHVEVLEATSGQFAARLRKTFKERRKWAKEQGITCYRIYDADLPDYAVAIDWYSGANDARGNDYLHIAEYAPPASIDEGKARRRFNDALVLAPAVCGVRSDHVFSKTRVRDKGGSQYRNAGGRSYAVSVEEGGYRFEVDLAGRLDTGLFLDHRVTREIIGQKAAGTRFLNLFAYTGTASVYAAGGGAVETTTVDLSQRYLDWAARNMRANGFSGQNHLFEKADVMRWITQARRSGKRYDLIFVDPPTFSNSKSMGKRTWDVQRDHVELLIGVVHLLAEGGEAVFSCNLRSFKPHLADLERYGVEIEDITAKTIPFDFSRTPKIHKCYLVRRRAR